MDYIYKWNLYWWGDRAFEDCIALVTLQVPSDWKTVEPSTEQLIVMRIVLDEDTENYLVSTYHTDVAKLITTLKKDIELDDVLEDMAENGDAQWTQHYE